MRKCPKCGRQFAENERVCPDDGSILEGSVSAEDRAVGLILHEKYRIDGFLKKGGMGAVYRGTHLMLNKPLAIKLIKPELAASDEIVKRFLREARAAAALDHPNIVTVHDLGQTPDGTLYIAMELVDGVSLKELILKLGPWEAPRAMAFIKQVARALAVAHGKGVVHRDLKPQNIMVSRDAEGREHPKLLDFGIARMLEPDGTALTATGMVLGTPQYMSTEQAQGQQADQRSDLYALGVILYEMLVGKVPFDDKSIPSILVKHLQEPPRPPSSIKGDIPPALEAVVLRCLEKDPENRFQSAEQFIGALDGISDTAAQVVMDPTVAQTAAGQSSSPPAQNTMGADAAAAYAPPPIPMPSARAESHTGTVRAREVGVAPRPSPAPARGGGGRLGLWLGLAGVAVLFFLAAAIALAFFIFGGGRDETIARNTGSETEVASIAGALSGGEETATALDETAAAPVEPPPPEVPNVAAELERAAAEMERALGELGRLREGLPVPVRTSESQTPAAAPSAPPQARAPAAPASTPIPEKPSVSIDCQGVRDGCALLRAALSRTLRREGMRVARPARAEVRLAVHVEEIESRTEQNFGTTFVVRTYSVSGFGEVPRFDDSVDLPPRVFTFDARLGRDKLRGELRVAASELAERIAGYWADRRK